MVSLHPPDKQRHHVLLLQNLVVQAGGQHPASLLPLELWEGVPSDSTGQQCMLTQAGRQGLGFGDEPGLDSILGF